MDTQETQIQPNPEPEIIIPKPPSAEKKPFAKAILVYSLLVLLFFIAVYFVYIRWPFSVNKNEVKQNNQPKVLAPKSEDLSSKIPEPEVDVAKVQSIVVENNGKLVFPAVSNATSEEWAKAPESLKVLADSSEQQSAQKLDFADKTTGYKLSFVYPKSDLVKVFESIKNIQEKRGWDWLGISRSQNFAFFDLKNSEYQVRLTLTVRGSDVFGEILAMGLIKNK
jgi:hypothetical protein